MRSSRTPRAGTVRTCVATARRYPGLSRRRGDGPLSPGRRRVPRPAPEPLTHLRTSVSGKPVRRSRKKRIKAGKSIETSIGE